MTVEADQPRKLGSVLGLTPADPAAPPDAGPRADARRTPRQINDYVATAVVVAAIVVAMQIASYFVPAYIIPAPLVVLKAFISSLAEDWARS